MKKSDLSDFVCVAEGISDNVGLTIINGVPNVTLPQGFQVKGRCQLDLRNDVINTLMAVEKYKLEFNRNININEALISEDKGGLFPFKAYLDLVEYYLRNGVYTEWESVHKIEMVSKKTNWRKTLHIKNAIFTKDGPKYLYYHNKIKKLNKDTIMSQIFMYGVFKSLSVIGFLYPNINEVSMKKTFDNDYCLNVLNKELMMTNDDIKKKLIRNLLQVFLGNDESKNQISTFTVNRTEYFWEKMLYYTLSNIEHSSLLPRAKWNLKGKIMDSSKLKPDILSKRNDLILILDAKYYQYSFNADYSGLPPSSDVVKQIAYETYIKGVLNCRTINAFLIPTKSDNAVLNVGYAEFSGGFVSLLEVDVRTLLMIYIGKRHKSTFINKIYDALA